MRGWSTKEYYRHCARRTYVGYQQFCCAPGLKKSAGPGRIAAMAGFDQWIEQRVSLEISSHQRCTGANRPELNQALQSRTFHGCQLAMSVAAHRACSVMPATKRSRRSCAQLQYASPRSPMGGTNASGMQNYDVVMMSVLWHTVFINLTEMHRTQEQA
jgi:hypothetical protein